MDVPISPSVRKRRKVRRWLTGAAVAVLLGLVTVVLVCNRLLAPQPLVHVETWLAGTVLPDLLGLDAAQCTDERVNIVIQLNGPKKGEDYRALLAKIRKAVESEGLTVREHSREKQ